MRSRAVVDRGFSAPAADEGMVKILIIDDERDVREIAHLSLDRLGRMDVREAESGEEGLAKALEDRPDVILLDVVMPSMDGPATLAALRGNPATADIPVIFLTAIGLRSADLTLAGLGPAGVLGKPFNPITLPAQIRAILEGR